MNIVAGRGKGSLRQKEVAFSNALYAGAERARGFLSGKNYWYLFCFLLSIEL